MNISSEQLSALAREIHNEADTLGRTGVHSREATLLHCIARALSAVVSEHTPPKEALDGYAYEPLDDYVAFWG